MSIRKIVTALCMAACLALALVGSALYRESVSPAAEPEDARLRVGMGSAASTGRSCRMQGTCARALTSFHGT